MRQRNRLYTVNKYNRAMFMPGDSYYNLGGALQGFSDKLGGVMGGGQLAENPVGGLIGGLGTAVGKIGGGLLSGGLESGAGSAISNIGGTVGSALSTMNPILGGIVSAASGIIGGGVNALWGSAVDQEKLDKANAGTAGLNNFVSNAEGFDDIQGLTAQENVEDAYRGGVFTSGSAAKKNEALKQARIAAKLFAGRSIDNNVHNIASNQMNNALANYSAYGGPLDFGGGALGLMQQNRYFDTIDKRSDALAGKSGGVQPIFTAKTFDDGGLKAAFLDSFGSDPIGAAVRYNQGLEALAAQEEARQAEVAREAERLASWKQGMADLVARNNELEAQLKAMPAENYLGLAGIPDTTEPLASPTPSPATPRRSSGNKNWDYIEDQLRRSGKFNDVQIEGIKYNLQRESAIDPTVVGDGGAAFGLGQWHGSRKPKDMSLEGQTQHLIETLSNFDGKEHWIGKGNYEGFMNARTPEEAHYYIAKGYERPRADIVAKVKRDSDMSLRDYNHQGKPDGTNYAFGGELGTNGTDWTNGLLYIDEGGSHESNPLEGVPMGLDPEGIPNLVEEGETVYNDYVFSDRMKVPYFMYKELGLGGVMKKKGKEMSFADASKKLAQESEKRPNDPISQAGLDASLARLAEIQETERMRKQAEEYTGLEYACGGKMGKKYDGFGEWPNILGWTPSWNPTTKELPKGLTVEEMKALAAEQAKQRKAQTASPASNKGRATASNRSSNFDFGRGVSTETPSVAPATPAMADAEFREAFPMIARPSDNPQSINWTDGSIWRGLADIPASSSQTSSDVPVGEEYNPYPTWMMYAPVVGSGINVLTDLFGLTNNADYTMADKLEATANSAAYAPDVHYTPIGDYMREDKFDRNYWANQLMANSRATDRALLNSSSPSRAAGLLANGYNTTLSLGNLGRQGDEYNRAIYEKTKEFNRKTNMFNSQMGLEADMANARYHQAAQQMGLSGLAQAAALRDQIDARVGAARSANLTNFFTSLGNIGRVNFALNQINSDKSRRHGARANGTSYDKVVGEAYGGKMKRK